MEKKKQKKEGCCVSLNEWCAVPEMFHLERMSRAIACGGDMTHLLFGLFWATGDDVSKRWIGE